MNNHRNPPKPHYYDTVPEGTCRWCNMQIGLTKTGRVSKSRWHKKCYDVYQEIFHTSVTRRAVWKRDTGKCNVCKTQCDRKGINGWQMDHIIPLIEANGDIKYWLLDNLQTLCKPCHKEKTGREATARALLRKQL